nr:ABC transporter substrate-binding protein [Halocatena pleomorpha]
MLSQNSRSDTSNTISRRKLLVATGASGMAVLAGCTGNLSGDSDGRGGTSDAALINAYNGNPVDLHFNSYATQNYCWPAGRCVFAPFLKYSFNDDKFLYGALSDLKISDQETTVTFRDDLTWDDGDEWTTEDLDVQLQLAKKASSSLWGYLDNYKIVDDKTARLRLSGSTNPRIIKFELTNFFVDVKAQTHERWLDASESEFLQWAWEDPVASGPFSFVNKDRQAFEFERNKHFYKSDNVNFNTYLIDNEGGATAQHQALISGREIDAATSAFVPPEIEKSFPITW